VAYVQSVVRFMRDDLVYRGEVLQSPRHNVVKYSRVPKGHIVLFDVQRQAGQEEYLRPDRVRMEAECLGLEPVREIYCGPGDAVTQELLAEWVKQESQLGGAEIEGVVIKNYGRFAADGKALLGKFVRESFKEAMGCRTGTKGSSGIEELYSRYNTEARWQKAFQHLKEAGGLLQAPQDIPKLFKEVHRDLEEEEMENIKDILWGLFGKRIKGGATKGLAEWYKNKLVAAQFGEESDDGGESTDGVEGEGQEDR